MISLFEINHEKEYISHDMETRYDPSFYNSLDSHYLSSNEHRRDNDRHYETYEQLQLANYRMSINYKDNIKYDTRGHLDIVEK